MAWSKESIIHLTTVDSTNRYIRDEAVALWGNRGTGDFAVVTAEHQTAGRGQRGNTWNSNAGENLLFSLLVRPGETLEVSRQFLLSQAVALSIHDAMKCYGVDTRLKWPNDIYAGNRKLAGILLELDYSGAFVEQAIIGIGLNVNQEDFPPMDRKPVSMKMLREHDFILDDVLATILDLFEHYYTELRFGNRDAIAAEYKAQLFGIDMKNCFIDKNGHFDAVIQDVESDGHLILRRNDGSTGRYAFKEVEMKI
ncbi:MAG: biotin--[Bacteroidaceae bacterium]|nr:biotin--[acetyl-CoA-carboxylase] ligase [Bacteroidaceae bacterium]